MAEGRILRVQLDYNPNSSSMSGASLDFSWLLWFALGAAGGGAVAFGATRPAIAALETASYDAGSLERERRLALSFHVEKLKQFPGMAGEPGLAAELRRIDSGLQLSDLARMVEEQDVRITMIGPAIDAPDRTER